MNGAGGSYSYLMIKNCITKNYGTLFGLVYNFGTNKRAFLTIKKGHFRKGAQVYISVAIGFNLHSKMTDKSNLNSSKSNRLLPFPQPFCSRFVILNGEVYLPFDSIGSGLPDPILVAELMHFYNLTLHKNFAFFTFSKQALIFLYFTVSCK